MNLQRYATAAFYGLLFSAALFLATLPFCPWTQQQIMQKFHLRTPSFARFAILQFLPSMYNFDNEAAVSTVKMTGDPFSPGLALRFQTNHYPLRVVTFGLNNRKQFHKNGALKYVYLRSRFNSQKLNSLYVVEPKINALHVKLER